MPVITNHKKLSTCSSQSSSEKSCYSDSIRGVSILTPKTSFEERFLENILALENTFGHKMVRRPNRVSLRGAVPVTYFSNGKLNVKTINNYSKRYEANRTSDSKQTEKKFSGDLHRKKSESYNKNRDCLSRLSLYDPENTGDYWIRKKNLRLAPVLLPPIHTVKQSTLTPRETAPPARVPRGPITDDEWNELQECRYIRPGLKKFRQDPSGR
ncbi:hypothetical protein SNE40_007970 [Patella caerulea]|uniref:Uncharacterized protein n=1 Tax=Patella caerulea TaxID=87958 RepID=A0AAN8JUS6_PATCE